MKLNKGRTLIIGNFEVIHKGHSKLFNKANKPFVYTFKNLPNKKDLPIYSFEQKIQNLLDLNVADIFVLDFKKQNLTANQFIRLVKNTIDPTKIIVGSDFKFGKDMKPFSYLKKYFDVFTIKRDSKYSTTKIRQLLTKGNVSQANKLLVSPLYVTGVVQKGKQLGRTLGFRTANVARESNLLPIKSGVYYGLSQVGNSKIKRPSAISIRNLNNKSQLIEIHIIDYKTKEFYGKKIRTELLKYIGQIKRVDSSNKLKDVIKTHIITVKKILKKS